MRGIGSPGVPGCPSSTGDLTRFPDPRPRPHSTDHRTGRQTAAGLFNPGKIVNPPPMDEMSLFRFPPPQAAPAVLAILSAVIGELPAQQVILTGAEEKVLFHQFNYARYRIWKIQQDVWASPSRKPTAETTYWNEWGGTVPWA